MEAHVRTPDPLKDGKMDVNWRRWKNDFMIFMKASGFIKKPEDEQAYLLLNLIGDIGREVYQKFVFENPADKEKMDVLLAKFDEEFDPPKMETKERYAFFTRYRKNNETIEAYIDRLQEMAKTCNFGDLTESLVRDKVILDTKDKTLRNIYLDKKNLTLSDIVNICNDYEQNLERLKEISITANQSSSSATCIDRKQPERKCWRCNTNHPERNCPAWGKICGKCNEKNHFTQCCKNYLKKGSGKDVHSGKNNENKNINQTLDKSATKTTHPFHQVKESKKTTTNNDLWTFVESNTYANSSQSMTTQESSSNEHVPYKDFVYNKSTDQRGANKPRFQNVKHQLNHNQHRGQFHTPKHTKQPEPDCVIS